MKIENLFYWPRRIRIYLLLLLCVVFSRLVYCFMWFYGH